MASSGRGFLRDNAFLIAAATLPIVVVGFFLAASFLPRWWVPPPAYDLVLSAGRPYNQAGPRVSMEFRVHDGKVEARVRPLPLNSYPQLATLWLFEHDTSSVRQIPVNVPEDLHEGDPPRTIVVESLAGRRVVNRAKAPDGYALTTRSDRGSGLVGDLFGMHSYEQRVSLVNRGRVIPLRLPAPYEYQSPIQAVGWIIDERAR